MKHSQVAKKWQMAFHSLSEDELIVVKRIISLNKFSNDDIFETESENVREVLKFYQITRH